MREGPKALAQSLGEGWREQGGGSCEQARAKMNELPPAVTGNGRSGLSHDAGLGQEACKQGSHLGEAQGGHRAMEQVLPEAHSNRPWGLPSPLLWALESAVYWLPG